MNLYKSISGFANACQECINAFLAFAGFRHRRTLRHLRLANSPASEDDGIASAEEPCLCFTVHGKPLRGWYMLEMKIGWTTMQVKSDIYIKHGREKAWTLGLPLYSGRIGKRLIYLNSDSEIYFGFFNPSQSEMEFQHFRLVRVRRGFARSRMLLKLQALHPLYKLPGTLSERENKKEADKIISLGRLWADYCALFEDLANIVPYQKWIQKFDSLNEERRLAMSANLKKFGDRPLISILLEIDDESSIWLEETIQSVCLQNYSKWELWIVSNVAPTAEVQRVLMRYVGSDARINLGVSKQRESNIATALNDTFDRTGGEWIVLLDQSDVLAECAMYWIVEAINKNPAIRLIYSDEDQMDEFGSRSLPNFKPDWNPDLFYSRNMLSHLGAYRADLVRDAGAFRVGFEGSENYDLVLRCIELIKPEQIHHVPRVLYHCRVHPDGVAHSGGAKRYAVAAGEKALNEHFKRQGVNARAQFVGQGYRVHYPLPDVLPLVSLVIPTRNGLKLIKQCVESILKKTAYSNYEILIIDNGSDDPATLCYLTEISSEVRIRVIRDDSPFNYSALNNAAVKLSHGEIVGLINNDTEVISEDWLSEMVSHALRPEVGAVGARLWYGDDTLQHAGVVLGLEGFAGHVHRYLPRGEIGYCGRAVLSQSLSAVTGACLVVRKSVYEAVGGMNETDLQVACNDIDLCLRLREAGYRNIWTPYAELYHHESATRGCDDTPERIARSAKEVSYMWHRWADILRNDPAYSPNLSLDASDFRLAWPPRVEPVSIGAVETAAA